MGSIAQCKYCVSNENQLSINRRNKVDKKESKVNKIPLDTQPFLHKDDDAKYQTNVVKIVRIQSFLRGHLARKKHNEEVSQIRQMSLKIRANTKAKKTPIITPSLSP